MSRLLEMRGISKEFPGVKALNHVDLELDAGEVLALLGENGAGKSTLLKILAGAYMPDSGEIFIDGEKQDFKTPSDAREKGIGIIYQELYFYNELSVAENIFAGKLLRKNNLVVDWRSINAKAKIVLEKLGANIDPTQKMKALSTAQKQLVEIAKALVSNTKILVMDEPTSALNDVEVEKLLSLVKELSASGIGIIYISHKLEELFAVADRVQVMRDGERIDSIPMSSATTSGLIRMMVGREIKDMYPKETISAGDVVLEVQNLRNEKLKGISFNVKSGEILGVFGLMGAGRTEMCKAIFGAAHLDEGVIIKNGKKIKIRNVSDAKKAGIAYLPNERKTEGLILSDSVKDNLYNAVINIYTNFFGVVLDQKRANQNAEKWINELRISTPSGNTPVGSLSGGNQQKVVLGKWLETNPDVIILNEPTRGIDVGAKVQIYKLIEDLCKKGMAVILVSSEQAEILSLTDRVIVLCEGRLTGELSRDEYSQENLMELALRRENNE